MAYKNCNRTTSLKKREIIALWSSDVKDAKDKSCGIVTTNGSELCKYMSATR